MKRIIRDEIDADFRQHLVEKAIVAGFNFPHMHAMLHSLQQSAQWDGDRCVQNLIGVGHLTEQDAKQVVTWLDKEARHLLDDAAPRPIFRIIETPVPASS